MVIDVSFSDAVLLYKEKLLIYALKLTKRKELAEDLVNDLYVQALEKTDVTISGSTKGYVSRSLYNLFIGRSKSGTRHEYNNTVYLDALDNYEYENATGKYSVDMEDALNIKRMLSVLEYKIDTLPEKQKEMVRCFLKHQSVADAARSVGGNFETAKHSYFVGVQNLKEMLCGQQT